uniref:Tyrosinase_Cu-bd domain-containing protein n=1 Tax=Wuchereria bancrofti TaxID=6293 RepID=A0A1I8EDM7_WUCBA
MEIALRLIDPSIALPYWDSSLDQHLSDPRDSVMWTDMLMGESNLNGEVINGPFAGFITLEACPYPPNFAALEYYHASVHIWIGGDMKPPSTSANDPVFFLHHSFVDYIFENWRQMHQNRIQREQDYPEEIITCTTPRHFANANMRPFNLVNKHGLSNSYTDYLYTYAPRPNCSASKPTCQSQFLFCDLRNGPAHCVSKIKLGKRCEKFIGEDVCYMGICLDGYCKLRNATLISSSISTSQSFQHITTKPPFQQHKNLSGMQQIRNALRHKISGRNRNSTKATIRTTTTAMQTKCLNDDPCCNLWAKNGECPNNVVSIGIFHVPICDCEVNAIKEQNGWQKIAKLAVVGVTFQLMIYWNDNSPTEQQNTNNNIEALTTDSPTILPP